MRGGGSLSPPVDKGGGGKAFLSSEVVGAVVQHIPPSREFRRRPVPGSEPRNTRGSVVKQMAKTVGLDDKVQLPLICGLAAGSPIDGVVDMEEAVDGTFAAPDGTNCPVDSEGLSLASMVADGNGAVLDTMVNDSGKFGPLGGQGFIDSGRVAAHIDVSNSLVGMVGVHLDTPPGTFIANR